MSAMRLIWGLLFRLFPAPTEVGLRRVGHPDRDSPVLVTCNFDLTVRRLRRALRGLDAWLLVGQSRGVNVWCAAGGDEFNTHSVVAAVKTSGIADLVDHRTLILPVLGAPGIRASDVEEETGWAVRWGPVRMEDIPRYLAAGQRRDEAMSTATYTWVERLDTGLGSLFPFYLLGAVGFALFGRGLLVDYLLIGAVVFAAFFMLVPWIPGRRGVVKALVVDLVLGAILAASELAWSGSVRLRADLIIAMAAVLVYGSELGGLASTMASEFDPLLARLGVKAIGNVAFAGTVRTDLLNGARRLQHVPERCTGCGQCVQVCPRRVWREERDGRARLGRAEDCTGCVACIRQCTSGAILARRGASAAAHA